MAERPFSESMILSTEDVLSFLEPHRTDCWVCGSDVWIVKVFNDKPLVAFHQTMQSKGVQHVFPCYTLVCNTCANVWFVSMEQVEKIVASQRPATGGPVEEAPEAKS